MISPLMHRKSSWAFLLLGILLPNAWTQTHSQSVTLGVLVDLHEPSVGRGESCGPLNVHTYQKYKAIEWAVETINNKSFPGEFSLEIQAHDTCGESGVSSVETARLLKWAKENPQTPLIGLIVIGSHNNEKIIDRPLETLNNVNVSAIVTSARAAGLVISRHNNVFTTAPDLSSVTEGIVALINQLGASNVAIISSDIQATKKFQRLASTLSVKSDKVFTIQKDNLPSLNEIGHFLQGEAANVQSVIMLLESTELENLVGEGDVRSLETFKKLVGQKSWILGSVGMDSELVTEWSTQFHANLLVMQPRASINSDFHTYFVDKLFEAVEGGEGNEQAIQYLEAMYHCQGSQQSKKPNPLKPPCSNLTKSTLMKKLHPETDIGFIVNAVSAYSAALRLAQLSCNNSTRCENSQLSTKVLNSLRSLNLPAKNVESQGSDVTESTISSSHEIEGTQMRINFYGKMISRKFDLILSRDNGKLTKIGQYSHEDGLVLDVMLGIKLEGGTSMQDSNDKSVESPVTRSRQGKTAKTSRENREYMIEEIGVTKMMSPPEIYISRVWAMAMVAVAITGVFISMYMLIYVLQRMCDGTLRGNQVLGILLLLGIIMMYSSVVLFVLPPGVILCNFKVFLPSIATAICFGILMLKAMQLRSLVSLGLGGRVPALNQFITLVFIVAVQVALNIQWFFSPHEQGNFEVVTSSAISKEPIFQECFYSHHSYLYLHTYLGFLMLVVFLYGTSVLKIRRNYNEAKWITLASCLSLPIAVAWTVVVHVGPSNFQEPAACAAFITTATVLLFSIFIPKLNTISQQSAKLAKRKQTLKSGGPPPGMMSNGGGSISTIFTNLSGGTLQSHISQKRNSSQPYVHQKGQNYINSATNHNLFVPPAPLKSVDFSPRLTTNFYHSSSAATSLARSTSKTPFFDSGRAAYP